MAWTTVRPPTPESNTPSDACAAVAFMGDGGAENIAMFHSLSRAFEFLCGRKHHLATPDSRGKSGVETGGNPVLIDSPHPGAVLGPE